MNASKHPHKLSDIETIIVGVDMSESSKDLVEEAQWLSEVWDAKLVLVNVRSMDPYVEGGFATQTFWDEDVEQAKREIQQFYNTVNLHDATVEIVFGDAAKEIETLAAKYPHPLVLVGHSHKSKWEKFLMGSASNGLARHSTSPVLIY
jgi:nucleotide-binding universal stress UspA family protein